MSDAQEYLDSARAKYASRDLHRATQALHDAAVAYAVGYASDKLQAHQDLRLRERLFRAAEDYADAYLRHG